MLKPGKFFGKTVNFLATPEVKRQARLYYECDTVDGVALEDEGGSGTKSNHWERLMLNDELMTGT